MLFLVTIAVMTTIVHEFDYDMEAINCCYSSVVTYIYIYIYISVFTADVLLLLPRPLPFLLHRYLHCCCCCRCCCCFSLMTLASAQAHKTSCYLAANTQSQTSNPGSSRVFSSYARSFHPRPDLRDLWLGAWLECGVKKLTLHGM